MTNDLKRTDANPSPRQRDDEFYIDLVTFEVEGILFRVPRNPFEEESEIFKDMLALPKYDESMDGRSDEQPVILHGASARDFRALLKVLFKPVFRSQNDLTQEEWISVLRLTHLWNFRNLLNNAVNMLEGYSMEPALKISLARKHNVTKWLRPAFFDLVMRLEPLAPSDADMLGIDCVLRLAQIREMRYRWILEGRNSDPPRPSLDALKPPKNPDRWTTTPSSEIGLDPGIFPHAVKDFYAEALKKAMRDAIDDAFGLCDRS